MIVIKYFNLKMLLTLDVNKMVEVLINEYGSDLTVEFKHMSNQEQAQSSKVIHTFTAVRERFQVFENKDSELIRKPDLEHKIVKEGIK